MCMYFIYVYIYIERERSLAVLLALGGVGSIGSMIGIVIDSINVSVIHYILTRKSGYLLVLATTV